MDDEEIEELLIDIAETANDIVNGYATANQLHEVAKELEALVKERKTSEDTRTDGTDTG